VKATASLPFALLLVAACSSGSSPAGSPAPDAGAPDALVEAEVPEGGGRDAGPRDAGSDSLADAIADAPWDGPTPYEQSVLAARWQVLSAAPTVGGGAKQDDVFFLDASHGWLASGPNFALYQTTDGGMSWKPSVKMSGTYFRTVLFTDAMHGFAGNIGAGLSASITDANVLYATADGGGTWKPLTSAITGPAPSGLCNLTAVDSMHLIGVGRANGPSNLIASGDGGKTWASVDLSSSFSMVIDARFTTPTDGLIVGMDNNGFANVVHTPDGGKTLKTVFTSKTASSLSWKISFPSDLVGYVAVQDAAAGPPTIAKTIDGGTTWDELPLPVMTGANSAYPAIGVGFITEHVGWVSPEDPTLPTYVTADGGKTWKVDPALMCSRRCTSRAWTSGASACRFARSRRRSRPGCSSCACREAPGAGRVSGTLRTPPSCSRVGATGSARSIWCSAGPTQSRRRWQTRRPSAPGSMTLAG
jgi:photosystem II stability/assembly factor-like uncharacterized protein